MSNFEKSIFQIESGEGRYQVHLIAFMCGRDLSVAVTGGEKAHIGAVCLGQYEEERDSATVSTICVYGHRDDQLAMVCAKKISSKFQCTVTVSVGIHIDDAASEEIKLLGQNCMDCVEKLLCRSASELYRRTSDFSSKTDKMIIT